MLKYIMLQSMLVQELITHTLNIISIMSDQVQTLMLMLTIPLDLVESFLSYVAWAAALESALA